MDLPDDFLSEPSVVKTSAANKFKPKAKPRPQKGPSVASKATEELPITSFVTDSALDQASQPNDSVVDQLQAPKSSSFTNNETAGTEDTLTNNAMILENQLLDGNCLTKAKGLMDSAQPGYQETFVPKSSEVWNVSADTSLGLQSTENIIDRSTTEVNIPIDTPTLDASSTQNAKASSFPDISFASASPFQPCTQTSHALSASSTFQDSSHYKVEAVCGDAGELWINIEEGAEGFSTLEDGVMTSDSGTVSGKRPVKFQPKPKVQISTNKDAPELAFENQYMNEDGSAYATEPHTISHLSNAKLDGKFPVNPTTMHPTAVVYEDADSWMAQNLPEQCGELGKSIASDALNSSENPIDVRTGLVGSETNDDRYEINYEVGDQVHDDSSAQPCDQSATSRGENNLGSETSKKKRTRKSKKVASEKDESGGKKRKTTKACDQSAKTPTKKVLCAPKKKRCVNKTLLETPEGEVDLQRIPIRDLLILAEYKERLAKKNAAAVQQAPANEGTENILSEDPPYEDGAYNFDYDQDEDSYDNPSTTASVVDTSYFNYHSFMDKRKTTKVRWSKGDTELFYQGIREFGSDFLMIQQLHFPGRTRNQIKLKYKKEERGNPALLHEALNSRAKDLSHFELLAQRVQKALQEEEDQMSGEEELDNGTLKTDATSQEEAAEPDEGQAIADQDFDRAQDASPANSNDNEDDFNWDDYKSVA